MRMIEKWMYEGTKIRYIVADTHSNIQVMITSFDYKEQFDEAWSLAAEDFVYRKGEWLEIPDFNKDRWFESTTGIHIWLTREEAMAINWHMGGFDPRVQATTDMSEAFTRFPTAVLFHVADLEATYLDEK